MADKTRKVPENVPGRYYVDDTCIDCDLCRETAPGPYSVTDRATDCALGREPAPRNFVRQDAQGYSFVTGQPDDPAEEAACLAALEECPVEAIGNDGQE